MDIGEEIRQKHFESEKEKALINILYTGSWINGKQIRFFKQFGLSPQQYNVLRILRGQCPETVSVSVVQERMLDKTSNVSRLIEKLRQRGLVKRNECPTDRRQMDLVISEAGLALLEKIGEKKEEMHAVMQHMTVKEAGLLNKILDKLKTT